MKIFPVRVHATVWIGICILQGNFFSSLQAQHHHFQRLTAANGLSQGVVQAIHQDREGFLWLGTQAGLNRYDGENFTVFGVRQGLLDDWINDIEEDDQGNIWVATQAGVSVFNGDSFHNYSTRDGLSDGLVTSLAFTRGSIWASTRQGLNRFNGVFWETYSTRDGLPSPEIRKLSVDFQSRLWACTSKGLAYLQGDGFIPFDPEGLRNASVTSVAFSSNDRMLVGLSEGLRLYQGSRLIKEFSRQDGLEDSHISATLLDSYGILWAGTGKGVLSLDQGETSFLGPEEGLEHSDTRALFEDREGTLWIGVVGGVYEFSARAFTRYGKADGLGSDTVRPILRDHRGILWVGTTGGLSYFDGEEWGNLTERDGLPHENIESLLLDTQGRLWIGTRAGLAYLEGRTLVIDPSFSNQGRIVALAEDQQGGIWCAISEEGIFRRTGDRFEPVTVKNQTFSNGRLLVDRKGRVWASGDRGLSVWNGNQWQTYTTRDGLADNRPYYLAEDRHGRIWFGYHSSRGVGIFDGQEFRHLTTSDGLTNDAVYSLGVDQWDSIWIGTARGMDRYNGEEFVHYSTENGYPDPESNAGGFFSDVDGTLWFGTQGGLGHFDPRFDRSEDPLPPIQLTDVQMGGDPVSTQGFQEFPHSQSDLHAQVRALSVTNPNRVKYEYRLAGFQDSWTPMKGNELDIHNLPPGNFSLLVRGRRGSNSWTEPVGFDFAILTPYWRTWWFWLLVASTLSGSLFLIIRLQGASMRRQAQELEKRVDWRTRDLKNEIAQHRETALELKAAKAAAEQANLAKSEFLANMSHEIRTPMNGIMGLSQLLLDTELSREQREYLEMVDHSAESLLQVINDILDFSKIEAGKFQLEKGSFEIRETLSNTLRTLAVRAQQKGLELVYRVAEDVPEYLVGDPGRLRQIVINLVGNAIKFTESGEVVVEVTRGWDPTPFKADELTVCLRFAVTDTGIGIPEDKQSVIFEAFSQVDATCTRSHGGTGLGLAISGQLVQMMGGRIWVQSAPARGSTFYFTAHFGEQSEQTKPHPSPRELEGLSTLIVDDNETNCLILLETLNKWKMQATAVSSGKEALLEMKRADSEGRMYSLLLLDSEMPEMDGFKLMEQIRKMPQHSETAIMMLTSANHCEDAARCKELGVASYLIKPVIQTDLLRAILSAVQPQALTRLVRGPERRQLRTERPLHILVVEDNRVNQRFAEKLLLRWGHSVSLAEDGKEALEAVTQETFDAILMDVQMPGMDGLQATRKIRELEESRQEDPTPILAMTAFARNEDRQSCLEAGMNGYVSKPVKPKELFTSLEELEIRPDSCPAGRAATLVPLPEVDEKALLDRVGGDSELLEELIELFLSDSANLMQDAERALRHGKAESLQRTAHTLKGLAGTFESQQAASAAHHLEQIAREGDLSSAPEALEGMLANFQALGRQLTLYLAQQRGSEAAEMKRAAGL